MKAVLLTFIWSLVLTAASAIVVPEEGGELLYNGIQLPKEWPPRLKMEDRSVRAVPYLQHPPAVIPIDVGRQLFVDDFLIETTDLKRTFHYAEKYAGNPVLKPETVLELNGGKRPCATLFNDGVCFDPKDGLFKIWYHAGWFDGTAYATSKDGLKWERPQLDIVKGSNRLFPKENHGARDGSAVWLDHFATDPAQRFKMFLYERPETNYGGQIFTSPDGLHWNGPTRTHPVGDNTTIFYNPFRKKWVYSVRIGLGSRGRGYRECNDLVQGAQWAGQDLVNWARADEKDLPDPTVTAMMPGLDAIKREAEEKGTNYEALVERYRKDYGIPTQLYNVDTVAYESLMLGIFTIHLGPANSIAQKMKVPKNTELELAYSRDGFYWDRPDRTPFIPSTRKAVDWDRAYLHTAATLCTVVGDRLYFYYGGWSGESPALGGDMYAGGSVGVAFLRRDGFASMDAGTKAGTLTTRPVTFKGKHMFVNLDAPQGELRTEILDENGRIMAPFSAENCIPVSGDGTRQQVTWKGSADLSQLSGQKVKFRFLLHQGELYAFWVSPDVSGASHGYMAAGGPEFDGPIDTVGSRGRK